MIQYSKHNSCAMSECFTGMTSVVLKLYPNPDPHSRKYAIYSKQQTDLLYIQIPILPILNYTEQSSHMSINDCIFTLEPCPKYRRLRSLPTCLLCRASKRPLCCARPGTDVDGTTRRSLDPGLSINLWLTTRGGGVSSATESWEAPQQVRC